MRSAILYALDFWRWYRARRAASRLAEELIRVSAADATVRQITGGQP